MEFREGNTTFAAINNTTTLVPAAYSSLDLTYNAVMPEAVDFSFRLESVKGNTHSAYSNIATYKTPVHTPISVVGHYQFSSHGMVVTWSPNSSVATGAMIQRADAAMDGSLTGPWTDLATLATVTDTYLDTGVATNQYYAYRVANTYLGAVGAFSGTSNAAFTGLPAPIILAAYYDPAQNGATVVWTNDTLQANGVKLERAPSDGSGVPTGPWVQLTLPSGISTSYLDQNIPELAQFVYRVTLYYDLLASPTSAPSYAVAGLLHNPTGLIAAPAPGGIQLTWQNHSLAASEIVVRRSGSVLSQDVAILSPATASYLDPNPPLGSYTYTVVAKNGGSEAPSAPASAITPNPPGALSLTATPLALPDAADAGIQPSGAWAFLSVSPFGIISNNDAWQAYFPGDIARSSASIIQVDAHGHPHAVFLARNPANTQEAILTHLWHDGANWQREEMGRTQVGWTSGNDGYTFTLDAAGVPQALLDQYAPSYPYGGSTSTLTYVHKVAGSWVADSLAAISPAVNNLGTYHLRLDTSGSPHLLFGVWSELHDITKDAGGNWVSTTLPTGSVEAGWYDFVDGAWTDANTASVFFKRASSIDSQLMVIQKVGGVWQAPVALGLIPFDGTTVMAAAASSLDRSRVAAVVVTSVGLKAYHLDALGWHETLVAASAYNYWVRIGFDASNKVHILTKGQSSGYTDFHE